MVNAGLHTTDVGRGAVERRRRRRDHAAGARAMAPWLLGVAPFGLVIGVTAARADIPMGAGWLTAPLVYAGSAQLASIELLDAGAAPVVVVLAVLAINARLVLYSAAMAPHWRGRSVAWQALAAYLLVDPSLAVGIDRYEQAGPADRRRAHDHYMGGAIVLWVVWLAAVTVGATAGAGLPAGLHLELVIPLFLVGEVVPRLTTRAMRRAVGAAVLVALCGAWVPLHLGPMLAMVAGVTAGLTTKEASS